VVQEKLINLTISFLGTEIWTPQSFHCIVMKNVIFLLCLPLAALAQEATISIDINRVIGQVDPNIYGIFMEPIGFNRNGFSGNTLYGPVYNPGSGHANEDGFSKEYIEAAKELLITNMRWPGGNFVANYNWMDGIGPKEERPVKKELAWGVDETNQVGTDEWVKLNKAIGSENVICLNLGTGGIREAVSWLEYCNSEPGTHYADLRVKYGNPEPYNVKFWCLGNEVDGDPWIVGHKTIDEYCRLGHEIGKAMKKLDRDISLIANGSSWYRDNMDWVEWNWRVINEFRDMADYLSIHRYWEYSEDYYVYMGKRAMDLEEKLSITAGQLETVQNIYRMEEPMYISFDEWAPHGRGLLSTLVVAQFFNAFLRHADYVKMANYTLLTSILGRDPETGNTYKTPFFHTFKMFSNNCHGKSLDVHVACDTFSVDDFYTGIPFLDVSTVYSEEIKSLIINVVNRHKDESIEAEILGQSLDFTGQASVREVYFEDYAEPYSYASRDSYEPGVKKLSTDGPAMTYTFMPHSFTQIIVKVDD